MKPWVLYSIIRLGVFAVAFILLMVFGIWWWLSMLIAAVLSFTIAYVFFGRLRDRVHQELQDRRSGRIQPQDPDADVEDLLEP